MTPATKLNTTDWKIPTDIKLADEHFHQPGNIDLLIGVDLFYEMSCPGRRTRPGNYPVLQETVLGWTIAGRIPANTTVNNVNRAFLQRETKIVKHQVCEERLHTRTTQHRREELWTDIQPRWNPFNPELLASLQNKDKVQN
jgi:hypothetical protein